MVLSKEIIDQALANIGNRNRSFLSPRPFTDYAPMTFTQPNVADPSQYAASVSALSGSANAQHQAFLERQENAKLIAIKEAKEREVARLQNQLGGVVEQAPRGADIVTGRNQQRQQQGGGNRWGQNDRPEVSDIGKLRPNAPIVTRNFHGDSYEVNKQVAPIFRAFLQNLWRKGYHPEDIQGYNDRNIAGTNTPSLHSYGFAIDVDPSKNPVQDAGQHMQTTLPPNVAAIAAKYGLAWGGSWNSYKDPMHFSVPFRGRE